MNIDLSICFFLLANRYIINMASCTMQIIGIPLFGDSMWISVASNSFTSVVAMGFWGTWQSISSPSKSAFKGFCYSEGYIKCFNVSGYHPKPYHKWPFWGRLSVHHHPVSPHEMHMKDVPYINHRFVKFQRDFSLSFLNIVYRFFSDVFLPGLSLSYWGPSAW